jgi:hypothetical protein
VNALAAVHPLPRERAVFLQILALSLGRGYGEPGDEGFLRGGNELLHVSEIALQIHSYAAWG